jgi:gluconokinase
MIIVIMGVAGSGKTTIGQALGRALGCSFYDSDDFHSTSAKEKMAKGIGLTDEDREPWLKELSSQMKVWESQNPQTILACSALKQKYRDQLAQAALVEWVYLKGNKALIAERLKVRQGHFVSSALLDSQFEALEEPKKALVLDISESPEFLVFSLLGHFRA